MDNKYLNKVLEKLENYRKIMQQIELLRYEIQHVGHVSPAEMIEVMTFQGRATNSNSTDIYTKDVPEIALSYQHIAAQLNNEAAEDLVSKYADLCQEQDRLLHYIGFLNQRQQDVIRRYYFEQSRGVKSRTVWVRHPGLCSGSDSRPWKNSPICMLLQMVSFGDRKAKRETPF